jgi:hypothetical protein
LFLGRLSDDPKGLATRLANQSVVLRLGKPTREGEIALAMAASLLLRMDRAAPAISVIAPARISSLPGLEDSPLAGALAEQHRGMASLARLSGSEPQHGAIELSFGDGTQGLPVRSEGWIAGVGSTAVGGDGNPIAAAFAGALGANEAFKTLLLHSDMALRNPPKPWSGAASLWDYSLDPADAGPELATGLDLDDVAFVGCGGVSAATFWTLALLHLRGSPLLCDDDRVDITNLNRLFFATHEDIGEQKVELVRRLLDSRGTHAAARSVRWEALEQGERRAARIAVVSVDDDGVRRRVQESLPSMILNGGTGDGGEYQVSRHGFLDGACLSCISHGDETSSSLEERVALHLGISVVAFLPHAASSRPLPSELIEQTNVSDEIKAELRAIPARRLSQRFCDELAMSAKQAVSAPTLSAIPGIFLAAELIKEVAGDAPELAGHNVLRGSVLRGPHKRWLLRLEKRQDCICTDETYRQHFANKVSESR